MQWQIFLSRSANGHLCNSDTVPTNIASLLDRTEAVENCLYFSSALTEKPPPWLVASEVLLRRGVAALLIHPVRDDQHDLHTHEHEDDQAQPRRGAGND